MTSTPSSSFGRAGRPGKRLGILLRAPGGDPHRDASSGFGSGGFGSGDGAGPRVPNVPAVPAVPKQPLAVPNVPSVPSVPKHPAQLEDAAGRGPRTSSVPEIPRSSVAICTSLRDIP